VNFLRFVEDACARSLLSRFCREQRNKFARKSFSLLTLAGIAAVLAITSGCGGGGSSSSPEQGGDQGTTTPPPPPPPTVFAVATYHNDNSRSGINSQETTLTPSNVNVVSFGKVAGVPVQGAVFAQPLYVSDVTLTDGKTHNVLVVATEHDQVYGIDADTHQVLWQRSFLDSQGLITTIPTSDVDCTVLGTEVGITGTPVIDTASNTIYLVAALKDITSGHAQYSQRIYALDLQSGTDKLTPVTIITPAGSVYGDATFSALLNLQRSALLLENGNVYVSWASHCDNGAYTGWVMAFNSGTLQQSYAWTPDPSGLSGGIWMGGGGPSADSSGNIFLSVGNGWSDAQSGGSNFGDSVVRLNVRGTQLAAADYFMPYDYTQLMNDDLDLGSGAPVLLPTQSAGRFSHLLVTGSKDGTVYLLNRDNLGQYQSNNNDQVVQSFQLAAGVYISPVFWNNTLYYGIINQPLQAYAFDAASQTFNTTPISSSSMTMPYPGVSPSLSSNNGSAAILWAYLSAGQYGELRAFDATDLTNELWDSEMSPDRDRVAGSARFGVPTVANGQVFVGAQSEVDIYGELSQ
jgi:hypothetical protein